MNKVHAVVVALLAGLVSLVFASEEWLHGKVTDVDEKPISGALIWLDTNDVTAMTDDSGLFQFDSDVPVRFSQRKFMGEIQPALLKGNSISFDVTGQPAAVRLEIVDLAGRCVRRVVNDLLSPKNYSFALPLIGLPASTYIVSLKMDATNFSWRVLVQENGILQIGRQPASAWLSNRSRAAEEEPLIALHCTREYYVRVDTMLSSFEGEVNFTMESRYGIKRPSVEMRGGDTVKYAVQNYNGWITLWDTDTIASQIIFDTVEYFLHPITQTLIDTGLSSFVLIPYRVSTWDVQSDTTVTRLLVLFDSTVTEDTEAPVITLKQDTVRLTKGDPFNLKDSMTITDAVDSHIVFMDFVKITDNIRTTMDRTDDQNRVIFNVPGTYTVNYEVIDTHMNHAESTRTIIVTKATESESESE